MALRACGRCTVLHIVDDAAWAASEHYTCPACRPAPGARLQTALEQAEATIHRLQEELADRRAKALTQDERIGELIWQRDTALAFQADAEEKLARLAAHTQAQLVALREEREALRKGLRTLTLRAEELRQERDAYKERKE